MKKPKYKVGDIVELYGYKAYLNPNLGKGVITHCNPEIENTYYLVDWERNSPKNTFCFEHNLKKATIETKFKKGDVVQNSIARGGIIRGVDLDQFGNPKYFTQWPNGFKGYSIDLELKLIEKLEVGDVVSLRGRPYGKIKGVIVDIRITHAPATDLRVRYIVDWPNGESNAYHNDVLILDALQFEIGTKVMADPTRPFLKGYKDFYGITKTFPTVNSDRYLVSWFDISTGKYIREEMMNGNLLVPFKEEVEVDDKVILKNGDIAVILEIFSEKTYSVLHNGKKNVLMREDFYLLEK